MLIVGLVLMRHIAESPFGYTLRLIRDNADRASFLGIDVFRVRLIAFVLASVFAALGGIIWRCSSRAPIPNSRTGRRSGEAIFMIMLGGTSTFLGPMVGSVLLMMLNDIITRLTEHHGLGLGVVILILVLVLRKGVTDLLVDWWQGRRAGSGRS